MSNLPTNLSSVTTVAVDLAKHVFQVHGCDAAGRVLVAKALRRKDVLPFFVSLGPCRIGMEACASAHHWGRELIALGHEVKLIPPTYVKPFVKRQKNDKNDAAAIYEAMLRPGLRFVAVRSIDNQALLMEHKVREILVQQRTQLLNGLRGHLAEIGVIAAQGTCNMRVLGSLIHEGHSDIPEVVRHSLIPLVMQITHLDEAIKAIDSDIAVQAKADPVSNRLMTIPGIGPVTATALVATVGDPARFSAFLGLVPRQNSSGGKARLGPITKMGNRYLRKLLVVGAHAVLHHHAKHNDPLRNWARKLLETKPFKLVAVATANKLARIAFALMSQNTRYQAA